MDTQGFERLKILGAAAALREFTVTRLASYSGAKQDTVRSVLRRDSQLFERVPNATAAERSGVGAAGRPPGLYRVRDPKQIQAEMADLERDLVLLRSSSAVPAAQGVTGEGVQTALTAGPTSTRDPDASRLAALEIAEDAIFKSWRAGDPNKAALLANTAKESLSYVSSLGSASQRSGDSIDDRAQNIGAFADLAQVRATKGHVSLGNLRKASDALAGLAETTPLELLRPFMSIIVDAAIQTNQMPPLEVILEEREQPDAALRTALGTALVEIKVGPTRKSVWSQPWARALVSVGLPAGILVLDRIESPSEFEDALAGAIRGRQTPRTFVLGNRFDVELLLRVARAGAVFLPLMANIGNAVASALSKEFAMPAEGHESYYEFGARKPRIVFENPPVAATPRIAVGTTSVGSSSGPVRTALRPAQGLGGKKHFDI
jgi:hypothetical protein